MAKVDRKTLNNLKHLCRINLAQEEEEEILSSLNKVLDYVHLLDELDTSNIPCCNFVLRGFLRLVMRADQPEQLLSSEQFLSNAPDRESGLIRIPLAAKP